LHIVVMVSRGYREAVRTDKLILRADSRVKVVGNTVKAGGADQTLEIGGGERMERSVRFTMPLEYQGRRQCYLNR
jgi:hypothetical protein